MSRNFFASVFRAHTLSSGFDYRFTIRFAIYVLGHNYICGCKQPLCGGIVENVKKDSPHIETKNPPLLRR